ncbi:C40 family peptidase [Deinococcus sp.]|uniref:C40 family peptidase n=1 Tax=Deinococcus sp. TaxID=47478 RepID=UPI0025C4DEC2|nr:C40 family peptidase [Deinococcus sp.]
MNVSRILLTTLAALSLATASAASYTVQNGDTLVSIAQATGTEPDALMRLNNLSSPTVESGQVLQTSGSSGFVKANAAATQAAAPVAQVLAAVHARPTTAATATTKSTVARASQTAMATPARNGGGSYISVAASRYLGIRYLHGGTGGRGIDCSGFTMRVFQQMGIRLPRTAASQFRTGRAVSSRDLRPGDLVFFNTTGVPASHVGIYLGNGMMAGANSYFGRTMVEPLFSNPYWARRYMGARRIMG